jgi:preprotein translocase subunit SecA
MNGLSDDLTLTCFALIREQADRRLGTPHYAVQLMGGFAMVRGMLAEMATGEGKTLTATLPAAAAALAGIPVHVISSNDYLVSRDAEAMRPLYHALGLSVGTVTAAMKDPAERRAAYKCDITYVTGNQVVFDYLKDRIASRGRQGLALQLSRIHSPANGSQQPILRGLCFGIVDEIDSILIDEARTPLILSGPTGSADKIRIYKRALKLARGCEFGTHFTINPNADSLDLTERGRDRLAELARPLSGFWSGQRQREEWVQRALCAIHLYKFDHHYLVRDDKVQIIDQLTGRVSDGRSWERGLHQLIELKEGCPVTSENEALARISYQKFFRRYLRLAGMTGTAREVARELEFVYEIRSVSIPTRLPVQRNEFPLRVFTAASDKWAAVIESVRRMHGAGRPVLISTCSVTLSERLSQMLDEQHLPHRVLNARQDEEEALVVAEAGQPGRITVSTNMAGRGTDIQLGPGVTERGGLHVIVTERAEAARVDRQLIGRCGRQGDPGSYEMILSLEDAQIARFFEGWMGRCLTKLRRRDGTLPARIARLFVSLPQRAEEKRNRNLRRLMNETEEYLEDLLGFSGSRG